MLRVFVSMVTLLWWGLVTGADAIDGRPVLILGDSLSAGYGISRDASWPHLLDQRLHSEGYRYSVVNASISGDTTAGGARRLGGLLARYEPAVVVIALGANDGLRAVDSAVTARNLEAMISASTDAGASVVLVKVRIPPNYGPQYTAAFEGVYDDLGARSDLIYAPFMLERFALNRSAFQSDGLHPTAAVQDQILDTLWPSIVAAIDGDMAEAMFN